jgi:hypothetical protein
LQRVFTTKKNFAKLTTTSLEFSTFFQNFDFVEVPSAGQGFNLGKPRKIVTVPRKFNSPIDKWIKAAEIAGPDCTITNERESLKVVFAIGSSSKTGVLG